MADTAVIITVLVSLTVVGAFSYKVFSKNRESIGDPDQKEHLLTEM